MKALVTKQNPDGTYDEVGMNNRLVLSVPSSSLVRRRMQHLKAGTYRVELFSEEAFYGTPFDIFYTEVL
jgi:hypothetical protein